MVPEETAKSGTHVHGVVEVGPAAETKTEPSQGQTSSAPFLTPPAAKTPPPPIKSETRPPKKRPVGRPKNPRLDAPAVIPATFPPPVRLPQAPKITRTKVPDEPDPVPEQSPKPAAHHARGRRLTDLAPPKPAQPPAHHHPPVHQLGVPPLHFGAVLSASLRARFRPHWFGLAAAAALVLALGFAYGVWLLLSGGLPQLASRIAATGPRLVAEAAILATLYYIGRSLGQSAIIYGLAREDDARPVALPQQLGVGVNTFARRLTLDLGLAVIELALIGLTTGLVITGGTTWPVSPELQLIVLFLVFLTFLYLIAATALVRGLGGVILTLTNLKPLPAARLGWLLFSHRFELLGLRFVALALELALALPLAILAIGIIVTAPAHLQPEIIIATGLLAWLAGALFGAGTAAWWTELYRRLIVVTKPSEAATLLTGQPAHAARRGPLTLIVACASILITVALVLPWLKFN